MAEPMTDRHELRAREIYETALNEAGEEWAIALSSGTDRAAQLSEYRERHLLKAIAAYGRAEAERCARIELELQGANAMISAIERLVPNWRQYRDLAEAVDAAIREESSDG